MKKTFTTEVKRIETAFGEQMAAPRLEMLYAALQNYSDKAIKTGFDFLINTHKRLPVNMDIVEAVHVEEDKLWRDQEQKDKIKTLDDLQKKKPKGKYEVDAIRALEAARISSTITGKTHLMYENERKWPGRGWKENADKLKHHLEKAGKPA